MTGGGSLLQGIGAVLSDETGLTVRVADDPSISISPQDRARRHDATMQAYELYKASAKTLGDAETPLSYAEQALADIHR